MKKIHLLFVAILSNSLAFSQQDIPERTVPENVERADRWGSSGNRMPASYSTGFDEASFITLLEGDGCFDVTGISVSSIDPANQMGTFSNGVSNAGLELDEGIVLTTGTVDETFTDNTSGGISNGGSTSTAINDADLDALAINGSPTFDEAIITIDFEVLENIEGFQIPFQFASDEYNEYVCSTFNDVFSVFITGPGIDGYKSISLVPGTENPVAINYINNGICGSSGSGQDSDLSHADLYIDNSVSPYPVEIEFDGITKTIYATQSGLQVGSYQLKLALADVGDAAWDSGVFFGAMEATTGGIAIECSCYTNPLADPLGDCDSDGVLNGNEISAEAALSPCEPNPLAIPDGDCDGDGVLNQDELNSAEALDFCLPFAAGLSIGDCDGDGVLNVDDNCPSLWGDGPNGCPDFDNDGIADIYDLDDDNDGISDYDEIASCLGEISYEFYNSVPSSYTVDNIPSSGFLAEGNTNSIDVDNLYQIHTPSDQGTFSVRYKGYIWIDLADTYTFYTSSDDGSKLYIDNELVVSNDGLHGVIERNGSISLSRGLHEIEFLFFENQGGEFLAVQYQSTSISKQNLPLSILAGDICLDPDDDGAPNHLDTDSDDDGCSDTTEAGFTDNNADGSIDGTGMNADGTVAGSDGYSGTSSFVTNSALQSGCPDNDSDGISDDNDLDDDNDGIFDTDECIEEEINPISSDPNYFNSGIYNSGHNTPTLNSAQGWSSAPGTGSGNNEHIGMMFNSPSGLLEVITQGRANANQWVTSYNLEATKNGTDWIVIGSYSGNSDRNTLVSHTINNSDIDWTGLRINPTGRVGYNSMRFQFVICSGDFDNDGLPNHFDPDSDNDGCNDAIEAGFTDGNDDTFVDGSGINADGTISGSDGYSAPHPFTFNSAQAGACSDNDNDGIADPFDLDDDNDGVLDETECQMHPENLTWHGAASANMTNPGNGVMQVTGNAWANAYSDQTFTAPFNIEGTMTTAVNGMIGIIAASTTETTSWNDGGYKFQFNASNGMYIRHGANIQGWQGPSMIGTSFKLEISETGTMNYYHNGSLIYTSTVPLTEFKLTVSRGSFTVNQFRISGQSITCKDTNGNGTIDALDLDSDGDGCSDSVEAGNTPLNNNNIASFNTGTDANNNGLLDSFENGNTGQINYTSTYNDYALNDLLSLCQDFDGDNIPDILDLDDDNDGILDDVECTVYPENLTWHGSAASNMTNPTSGVLQVTGNAWVNAYSDQTFSAPFNLEGTITAAVNGMIGIIPASSSETSSWNDGGYKFQFNAGNGMYVRHGSAVIGWQGPSIVGTSYKLEILETGLMNYYHNGDLIYSSAVSLTDYKLTISRGSFTADQFRITGQCGDEDNDGIINSLDPDSDNDGCNDTVEAGYSDSDNDGIVDGTGFNIDGTVSGSDGYSNPAGPDGTASPYYLDDIYTAGCSESICDDGIDNDVDGDIDCDDSDCSVSAPDVICYFNVGNGWEQVCEKTVCEGTTVTLSAWPATDANTWNWTGPNGFTGNTRTVNLAASATTDLSGVYTVTYDDGVNCPGSTELTLTVNPNPQWECSFNINNGGWTSDFSCDTEVCEGAELRFTRYGCDNDIEINVTGPNSYNQTLGGGCHNFLINSNMAPEHAGTYTATATRISTGCYVTKEFNVNVTSLISDPGTISGGGTFCINIAAGETLTGTAIAGVDAADLNYLWQYRRKSTCSDPWSGWNDWHAVQSVGVWGYTGDWDHEFRRGVKHVDCGDYVWSNIITFEVETPITDAGTISGGGIFCGNTPDNQSASGTEASGGCGGSVEYLWQRRKKDACAASWGAWFDDVTTQNLDDWDPWDPTADYQFRRRARRTSCGDWVDSNIITFDVVCETNTNISGELTICDGESTALTASGGDIYEWSTGESGESITVSPTSNTSYTVDIYQTHTSLTNLVTEASGFNNSNFQYINSTAGYGNAQSLFNGIDDTNGATFHAFRANAGQTWGISYNLDADQLVTSVGLERRNDCCTNRGEGGVVQIYRNGTLVFQSDPLTGSGNDILYCSPAPNVVGDEVRYVILNGSNTANNDSVINFSEFIIGGDLVCGSQITADVTVNPTPDVICYFNVGNGWEQVCDMTVCEGTAVTMSAWPATNANTWEWIGPNGFTGNTRTVSLTSNATTDLSGMYTVTYTNENGCSDSADLNLTVQDAIACCLNNPAADCDGDGYTNEEELMGICGFVGDPSDSNSPFMFQETTSSGITDGQNFMIDGIFVQDYLKEGVDRHLTIKTGHDIILSDNIELRDLVIEAGASLDLNGFTVQLAGNITLDGSIIHSLGHIYLKDDCEARHIYGSGTHDIHELTIENPFGVTLHTPINVSGPIHPELGVFDLNNQDVVLTSYPIDGVIKTGSISVINVDADVIGEITIQRYVESMEDGYRLLGPPIKEQTILNVSDDFVTTGFEGSDYPSHWFTNIKYYEEDNRPGGTMSEGFKDIEEETDELIEYNGYWAYFPPSDSQVTLDATGEFYKREVTIPVTYTPGPDHDGEADCGADGWHCIINPYPSAIDLESACIEYNNIGSAIYILDHTSGGTWQGEYAVYNNGISVNGGSNVIASYQAFMVQATGPGAYIRFTECAKTDEQGIFFRSEEEKDLIKMSISQEDFAYESVIAFEEEATPQFDLQYDSRKITTKMFSMFSVSGLDTLGINTLQNDFNGEIPLLISAPEAGNYELNFLEIDGLLNNTCLTVTDTETNEVWQISEGLAIEFTIEEDNYESQRFIINKSFTGEVITQDPLCSNENNGSAQVILNHDFESEFTWFDFSGNEVHTEQGTESSINNIGAGIYTVEIESSEANCTTQSIEVHVNSAEGEIVNLTATPDYCSSGHGQIKVNVQGADEWSVTVFRDYEVIRGESSSETIDIDDLVGGLYTLVVQTSCSYNEYVVDISDPDAVKADFEAPNEVIIEQVNAELEIQSLSENADENHWYLDDSYLGEDDLMSITFNEIGEYSITLNSKNEFCEDTHAQDIFVSAASVISENLDKDFMVLDRSTEIELNRLNGNSAPVQVTLYDSNGRVVYAEAWFYSDRILINKSSLAQGMYFLEVRNFERLLLKKKIVNAKN